MDFPRFRDHSDTYSLGNHNGARDSGLSAEGIGRVPAALTQLRATIDAVESSRRAT